MAFDIIVFTQDDLENALSLDSNRSIGLCDNNFTLPMINNINYTAIGNVSAQMNISQCDFNNLNIICDGFIPTFTKQHNILPIISSNSSSYCMASSFSASYTYGSQTSFSASYRTSFKQCSSFCISSDCIMVNGYGINLI